MTISPLCGIFAKVHVLVQSDYGQVSVITSLGKEIVDSRVLGRGPHRVVHDYDVRIRGSKNSSLSRSIGLPRRNSTRGNTVFRMTSQRVCHLLYNQMILCDSFVAVF